MTARWNDYEGDYLLSLHLQSFLRECVYKRVKKNEKLETLLSFKGKKCKSVGIRKAVDNTT